MCPPDERDEKTHESFLLMLRITMLLMHAGQYNVMTDASLVNWSLCKCCQEMSVCEIVFSTVFFSRKNERLTVPSCINSEGAISAQWADFSHC